MLAPKFSHQSIFAFTTAIALGGFFASAQAQGVFEGSGEEETTPSCVGDGCGMDFPENTQQATESNASATTENVSDSENFAEASANNQDVTDDSTQAKDSVVAAQADSAATTHLDDEDDGRDYYVPESASEFRARKEGFSRRIQFGVRVGAGLAIPFGDNDGWNLGFSVTGGVAAKLPLTNTGLGVAAGLEFGYRRFSYDGKTDYSKDEATVSQMLFEIPVSFQYAVDDEGFFFGVGTDIQLKMEGESEFTQKTTTNEGKKEKDKRNNTLPTTGVELGPTVVFGYTLSSHSQIDFRGTFNLTNLLDQDVIAESSLMNTALHELHLNLGFTFLL